MKRSEKDNCKEILTSLGEAEKEIFKRAGAGDVSTALDLLASAQELTVRVGGLIENELGEGCEEVHPYEEYCELLYEIHSQVSSGVTPGKGAEKKLHKLRMRMKGSLDAVPVKKDIVFLPYKASMWDSLESVWRRADEDPEVNAIVIPIPYYDKNPDGSFAQLHYEGDLFPEDVPVTHFDDYNISDEHPDVIYIHNPYDDANFVTSVHPFFYSKNLKEYTDKLVYIPYFVLDEPDPDNEEQLKGLEHFVALPAVVNAHEVIVQSEAMKKAYVRIMTRIAGADTEKIWENKILGLGSPKVEKVLATKREDVKVPEDWQKCMTGADGKEKKVILYNTSVGAILKYDDRMIEKIRSVLKIFYENREDVTLLWRPHPLTETTLSSMRPELLADYRSTVSDFKEGGWGIYDDTPDMNRAIALSDAYYGDWSSLVWLYKKTGKPIMIQNADII